MIRRSHLSIALSISLCAGIAHVASGQSAPKASPSEAKAEPAKPELVQQERILATLKALPTKRSPNADVAHAEGLAQTEAWLVEQLKAIGLEPRLEPVQWAPPVRPSAENKRPEPREWNNILVDFPGTDIVLDTATPSSHPLNSVPYREVIVVGAHFDAVPMAPGADDNGSGVAALLELARAYKSLHDAGWTHDKTIRLVFFNLEEVGLVGSTHHVSRWLLAHRKAIEASKEQGEKKDELEPKTEQISLMLSLECLGYFSDAPGSQQTPFKPIPGVFEPPTVADNIVLVTISKHQSVSKKLAASMLASAPTLKVFRADFSPLPLPDLMRSDHAPFMAMGVPSFMVTDTANFRNPNYHKPTDTIDTLDLPRLTLVAKGIAGAVWDFADPKAPARPEGASDPAAK